jgi:hypothetical protein
MRSHENVLWFQISVNDIVIVQIVYSNQDLLSHRSRLEIRDTAALRFNECEKVTGSDEVFENVSDHIRADTTDI